MGFNVLLFDTSVATLNMGDLIIMDAVRRELEELFPRAHFLNTATHEKIGRDSYRMRKISSFSFVGGTNLLSSNMHSFNQWKINILNSIFLDDILLMGVGWWQYQNNPNLYTRILLRKILHRELLHSVRDGYTQMQLEMAGIENVINTGCPTMWRLTEDHCSVIPSEKSSSVVFTLTDYNKDKVKDSWLVEFLKKTYDIVYFWPQGAGDLDYIKSLNGDGMKVLPSNLNAYDKLLCEHGNIDYVGTRLHAGIRALQYKKRSFIIAVDNRAAEIKKDTNLPVISRAEIEGLSELVNSSIKTKINLNLENIEKWKAQFEDGF